MQEKQSSIARGEKDGQEPGRGIAVLLPGIGYTCDRPLLYYSGRLAASLGWEVLPVRYEGFPAKVRGDRERLMQSAELAVEKTEALLETVDWTQYERILFVSKSIGTVAAVAYAARHGLDCRHILFTPLEITFRYPVRQGIAFHGTADPWANTKVIEDCCRRMGIPLYETEMANHSLETGDVDFDISVIRNTMKIVKAFAEKMNLGEKT